MQEAGWWGPEPALSMFVEPSAAEGLAVVQVSSALTETACQLFFWMWTSFDCRFVSFVLRGCF